MYICLCNGLTERDVTICAQESGLRCPTRVYEKLGAEPQCGRCLDFASALIEQHRRAVRSNARRKRGRSRELSPAV